MKNIVLLTHGEFSKGIAQSCRFILGEVQNLKALSITMDENIAQTKQKLNDAIASFENDWPTILITEYHTGSHWNYGGASGDLSGKRPESGIAGVTGYAGTYG